MASSPSRLAGRHWPVANLGAGSGSVLLLVDSVSPLPVGVAGGHGNLIYINPTLTSAASSFSHLASSAWSKCGAGAGNFTCTDSSFSRTCRSSDVAPCDCCGEVADRNDGETHQGIREWSIPASHTDGLLSRSQSRPRSAIALERPTQRGYVRIQLGGDSRWAPHSSRSRLALRLPLPHSPDSGNRKCKDWNGRT